MKLIILILSFSLSVPALSSEKSDWGFSYGVFSASALSFRSASFWKTGYIWPFASVRYKNFHFNGPQVNYRSASPRDSHWSLSYRYFDDSLPPLSEGKEGIKNTRSSLQLLSFEYQHTIKYFNAAIKWVQALDRYKSGYAELRLAQGIYKFTNAQIKLGYGSRASNQYAYGSSAEAGLSNLEFSINSFIPIIDESTYLRTSFKYDEVLRSSNREASLVDGDDKNHSVMILLLRVLK